MNGPDSGLGARLLREHAPDPTKLDTHRRETQAMLDREDRRLRFHYRFTAVMWCLVVAMGTGYALVAGWADDKPVKVYFSLGVMLFMLLLGGAVQLVAGFIGRARLEVTRDIKGLEVRVLELEGLLRERTK